MIYTKNNLLLFFAFMALCGISIFLCFVIGGYFGKEGLLLGAMFGGAMGILLTLYLARKMRYILPFQTPTTFAGAAIGFVLASLVAVNSLADPLLPVLSIALIGVGGVFGKLMAKVPEN